MGRRRRQVAASVVILLLGGCKSSDRDSTSQLEKASFKRSIRTDADSKFDPLLAPPVEDRDRDQLPDAAEAHFKTDPNDADTDDDGLLDGWEVSVTNGIDLPFLGANPLRKDIFVEMDYMVRESASNGLAPDDEVVRRVVEALARAPVSNPDGSTGISIHLLLDDEVAHVEDLNPTKERFFAIKDEHFDEERAPIFRYCLWADRYGGGNRSGTALGIPHSDFIVSLGAFNGGRGGTVDEKVGTFLHELGHSLGLRHGGDDDRSWKPNHLSIMNYHFQFVGVRVGAENVFSFQPYNLGPLDESRLLESNGLRSSGPLTGYATRWFDSKGTIREHSADGSIDWNLNGKIDKKPQRADLDSSKTAKEVYSATPNEYARLQFKAGTIGSTMSLRALFLDARDKAELPVVPELGPEHAEIVRSVSRPIVP